MSPMPTQSSPRVAPPWEIAGWIGERPPLTLESLRGRVVVLHAFQMLCPGCVSHGLPQAHRIHRMFDPELVTVVGLHSVFEHHDAMRPHALEAFVHEYRLTFPIAIDAEAPGQTAPRTMSAYRMQGTPTLVLIDRQGLIRRQTFGAIDDLALGVDIGSLLTERAADIRSPTGSDTSPSGDCNDETCAIPRRA